MPNEPVVSVCREDIDDIRQWIRLWAKGTHRQTLEQTNWWQQFQLILDACEQAAKGYSIALDVIASHPAMAASYQKDEQRLDVLRILAAGIITGQISPPRMKVTRQPHKVKVK